MTYPNQNTPELSSRNQSIRKTIAAFASLFKDIPFIKYDNSGTEIERSKVPIIYGNKEKYIKRMESDPNEIDNKVQITLPRIEYGLLGITYDASRRLNQALKNYGCASNGLGYVNSPVPYDFQFELIIYTRNIEDANQIMEYILPFFYPDYNLKINFVPELSITKSVPFTFKGESQDEDASGTFDSPIRAVYRTLTFSAKSYVYGAPKHYKPILQAETNIYVDASDKAYNIVSNTGILYPGDIIFQGIAYDRAKARGVVKDISYKSNTITISSNLGLFASNTDIKSLYNTSIHRISEPVSGLAIESIITPVPDTYPPVGPYDYNIILNDYTA